MQHSVLKSAVPYYVRLYKVGFIRQVHLFVSDYLFCLCCITRIDDDDSGYEQDHCKKRKKPSEAEERLRADRWYYNGMDGERD